MPVPTHTSEMFAKASSRAQSASQARRAAGPYCAGSSQPRATPVANAYVNIAVQDVSPQLRGSAGLSTSWLQRPSGRWYFRSVAIIAR